MSWNALFGESINSSVKFLVSEVPELQTFVEHAISQDDLIRGLNFYGDRIDDPSQRRLLRVGDAIRFVTTIIERAEATNASSEEDLLDIYLQLEKGMFSPTLRADLLFPLVLVNLDLNRRLELRPGLSIESIDQQTHRARAPETGFHDGVNPYLAAAATHAIVLEDQEFHNAEGPVARSISLSVQPQQERQELVEAVCECLKILSGVDVGYAQICLRPIGWADGWKHDLPPIQKLQTVRRYPPPLNDGGWNKTQPTISAEVLEQLPKSFAALMGTNKRAQLAARRLFQVSLREQDDDKILDACIGIEALLGEQHDELVHRMGLRASVALAERTSSPERTYQVLKKVYGHRSKIVHGTEAINSTIVLSEGEKPIRTSDLAAYLLRELLASHLKSDPVWTPESLDEKLFDSLRNADRE